MGPVLAIAAGIEAGLDAAAVVEAVASVAEVSEGVLSAGEAVAGTAEATAGAAETATGIGEVGSTASTANAASTAANVAETAESTTSTLGRFGDVNAWNTRLTTLAQKGAAPLLGVAIGTPIRDALADHLGVDVVQPPPTLSQVVRAQREQVPGGGSIPGLIGMVTNSLPGLGSGSGSSSGLGLGSSTDPNTTNTDYAMLGKRSFTTMEDGWGYSSTYTGSALGTRECWIEVDSCFGSAAYAYNDELGRSIARSMTFVDLTPYNTLKSETNGELPFCVKAEESASMIKLFIGISGTQTWQNVLTDIDMTMVSVTMEGGAVAKVHKGFKRITDKIIKDLVKMLERVSLSKRLYQEIRVYICGHSLGGAVAQLLSVNKQVHQALNKLFSRRPHIHVITFGAPRVGNVRFAQYINNHRYVKVTRFNNHNDIVPTLPPYAYGYYHAGESYTLFESQAPQYLNPMSDDKNHEDFWHSTLGSLEMLNVENHGRSEYKQTLYQSKLLDQGIVSGVKRGRFH